MKHPVEIVVGIAHGQIAGFQPHNAAQGAWYYYENGEIIYNRGLIHVTTWHDAEGGENEHTGYIYVRSSGELATGTYYITNHNSLLPKGLYDFSEDGILSVN